MRSRFTMLTIATAWLLGSGLAIAETYPVVDTGQAIYYDGLDNVISAPQNPSDDFYGQDAQQAGNQPSYSVIADGAVVRDNMTGLRWMHRRRYEARCRRLRMATTTMSARVWRLAKAGSGTGTTVTLASGLVSSRPTTLPEPNST